MLRRFINLTTVVSVLLCLGLLLAWHRSPWGYDADSQRRVMVGETAYFLGSWGGGLRVVRQRVAGDGGGEFTASPGRLGCWKIKSEGVEGGPRFGPTDPEKMLLGFGWGAKQVHHVTQRTSRRATCYTFTTHYAVVAFPYWPLVLLAAVPPALWVRRWLRVRRWEVTGHCPQCGYDLRAAPDSTDALLPRCPECGVAEGEEADPAKAASLAP